MTAASAPTPPPEMGTGLVQDTPTPGNDVARMLRERQERGLELMQTRHGFDVGAIDEALFQRALKSIRMRQQRMEQIFRELFREGVHFGNPIVRDKKTGEPVMDGDKPKRAFDKPALLNPGASELQNFFRIECHQIGQERIHVAKDEVWVMLDVGAYDSVGRLLGSATAACSSLEPRFRFKDAREQLNNITKQAFKRAKNQVLAQVTGADAFFASEAELERMLDEQEGIQALTPTEIKALKWDALQAGISGVEKWKALWEEAVGAAVFEGATYLSRAMGARVAALIDAKMAAKRGRDAAGPAPAARVPGRDTSFDEMPEALRDEPEARY